jgi:glycerol dehydrogenase
MLQVPSRPLNMGVKKYVAEYDAADRLGELCKTFGTRAFIIGGPTALGVAGEKMERSLCNAGISYNLRRFKGVCSHRQIEVLIEEARNFSADMIVGVGGGKALDTSKAVAYHMNIPTITVPTIAATCAAWAPLSVLYTDDGCPLGGLDTYAPEFVVCDYSILCKSPMRYFSAGLGDSLAKWPELGIGEAEGNELYHAGIQVAKYIFDTCLEVGERLSGDVSQEELEENLRIATYIAIPLTGLTSELTSGVMGKSDLALVAHGVDHALLVISKKTHSYLHGERVTFGLIPHLLLNHATDEIIRDVMRFIYNLGLPLELSDLGLDESIVPELSKAVSEAPGIPDSGIAVEQIERAFYDYMDLVKSFKNSQ